MFPRGVLLKLRVLKVVWLALRTVAEIASGAALGGGSPSGRQEGSGDILLAKRSNGRKVRRDNGRRCEEGAVCGELGISSEAERVRKLQGRT